MIQFTQLWSKPKESRTALRYSQLAQSKALERSILISIPGVFEDLREWMISWARMTLSIICLPSTYPACSLEMTNGRMGLSQLAMTFAMIL